jgi:hypothetical protein
MYLVYVDESGDDGLRPGGTDWFVISGVIVHESYWNEIFQRFLDLRRNLSRSFSIPQRIAFHATDIVNGHGDFHHSKYGLNAHDRFDLYRQIIEFLAQLQEIRVLNVCIRKRQIPSPNAQVFEWAWEKFIQRFQTFLERGGSGLDTDNDYGFLLTDRTHDVQLRRLMRKLRAFNYVPSMIPGAPRRKLLVTRLLDDPIPRESTQSYFVQMADLIAYALARKVFPRRGLIPYNFETYFDILDPILLKEASRSDPQGVVYWP